MESPPTPLGRALSTFDPFDVMLELNIIYLAWFVLDVSGCGGVCLIGPFGIRPATGFKL